MYIISNIPDVSPFKRRTQPKSDSNVFNITPS